MQHHNHRTGKGWSQRLAAAGLCALVGSASAADFTLSGNFSQDDQVHLISLVLDSASAVTITSLGYAGGTDTLGQQRSGGGFDTMLYLYDAAGSLLSQSDDSVDAATDPSTGLAADAGFSTNLGAGRYTLALTQYDNSAMGDLADGFYRAGTGNFTPTLSSNCTVSSFCDWTGAARSSQWVLAITGVSAVPEPTSLLLMLGGVAGLAGLRARQRQAR